jgi:hypothetical protein
VDLSHRSFDNTIHSSANIINIAFSVKFILDYLVGS